MKYMEDLYLPNTNVHVLNTLMFKQDKLTAFLKNKKAKIGLINFYAPWCIHCRKMYDLWLSLATQFKDKFHFCAVNSDLPINYPLRWKFNITQYPTLKYFDETGTLHDYDLDMDKDTLLLFITDKLSKKKKHN